MCSQVHISAIFGLTSVKNTVFRAFHVANTVGHFRESANFKGFREHRSGRKTGLELPMEVSCGKRSAFFSFFRSLFFGRDDQNPARRHRKKSGIHCPWPGRGASVGHLRQTLCLFSIAIGRLLRVHQQQLTRARAFNELRSCRCAHVHVLVPVNVIVNERMYPDFG